MTSIEAAIPNRCPRTLTHFLSPSALACLLNLIGLGTHTSCLAGGPASAEVRETFAGQTFDRARWSVDRRSPPGVQIDLDGEALHVVVPPGAAGRPPAALHAKFALEGNFDIRANYAIKALPRPSKEWSNVEIFINGPDGAAAVIRTNHASQGNGYNLWFEPAPGLGIGGAWKHVPTGDKAGTLRLERVGRELRFWAAASGGQWQQIGSVPFGDQPIRQVEVRAITPALASALDFRLDDVIIRADRLIEPPRPSDSMSAWRLWVFVGIAALVLAAFWIWWRKSGFR